MTEILTHPTWDQMAEGASHLVKQLRLHGWSQPKNIIGLTRGGLIPAVSISHEMDIPMIAVNYSSVVGRGDNKDHANALPAIYGRTASGTGEPPTMPEILIVDDICDSGNTLKEVFEHYSKQGHRVWTAALYYKEGAVIEPDFYWHQIPKDSPWIIFPFEVEE